MAAWRLLQLGSGNQTIVLTFGNTIGTLSLNLETL